MCSSWPAPHEAPDHFVALDNNRKYNALVRCSAPPPCELDRLRGRDLVCVSAARPCHGDLLLRLTNQNYDLR